jgi:hypothetical protein
MKKEKLKKQIDDLISDEFQTSEELTMEDMTPTMSDIYYWGLRNLTIKKMKEIIKRNK